METSAYTDRQFVVLDSVADGPELFFYPFSEVNAAGAVAVPGAVVAQELLVLIADGLVSCERVRDSVRTRVAAAQLSQSEFAPYTGYAFTSIEQHLKHFGYGPHEFALTPHGKAVLEQWVPPAGYVAP